MTTYSELPLALLIACAAVLAGVHALVCWAAGRLLIGKGSATHAAASLFALGHAALAVVLQLTAVAGFFRLLVIGPLLLAVLVFGLLRAPPRESAFAWRELLPRSLGSRALVFGVACMLVLLWLAAFSLPGTDALAYYMAQPKLIAAVGVFRPLPAFESFAVLPAVAEMPYTVMYLLGGDAIGMVASKFSMWPVLVAILLLLWKCARDIGISKDAAWLLMAMLVTSTAVTLVAWDGKTDLVGLMYLLAAVVWIPGLAISGGLRQNSLLFGLMAAAAVMAKFSYALILPFVLGIPLALLWWREPRKLAEISVLAGAGVVLAFALGWWSKNWLLFSDPFAPILRLHDTTPKFALDQVWFSADYARWIARTFPLAVTFGKYPMQHGGISPFWLMLLPALWMKPWQSEGGRKALYLALGSVAALAAWVLLRPSVIAPRYFLPALVLPSLILVLGYQLWLEKNRGFAYATLAAVLLMLAMHVQSTRMASYYATGPFVNALRGTPQSSPLTALVMRLEADPRPQPKVLLLSYATEALPSRMLTSFAVFSAIKKGENVFDFALREKVDYILYSANTHKRADIDLQPPPGLKVEKIVYLDDVYSLYVLTRDPDGR